MALDYRKCAEEIARLIGGGENVASAAHCATRLRLVIVDNSKIDKAALEEVEGVKGMFESNGQLQLIIGTGTVNKVYDEFLAVTGVSAASKEEAKAAAAAQMPLWKRLLKTPGDVFVPILPAIVAAGLMMGLVEALGKAIPGFADTSWYLFLDLVSNTAFAYLPVLVAISSARVFGANIFLGAVIGLAMIHSGLTNAWVYGSMSAAEQAEVATWSLLPGGLLSFKAVGYQGHVIPVILAVYLLSIIEKWLHKHVPEMFDLFITPICSVLATVFLTFTIIGPIFSTLETWVLAGATILVSSFFGIGAMIMGAIYPFTVVMGLHHMYNVIEAGMLSGEMGKNIWMPIASAANFAQFGACLAVGLKAKNARTKAVALPSSLSASLGITEPAIFGINFRYMKPFIAGMIGGACGSLVASLSGIGAVTYGVTGIPGLLAIKDGMGWYILILLISGGIAFAITWFIWKEDEEAPKKAAAPAAPAAPVENNNPVVIKCEAGELKAPCKGVFVAQEDLPDPMFAGGALGAGCGIEPAEGIVIAPCDGEISTVAETGHAIGISAAGDMEILIHIGVDTVKMGGKGFKPFVKEGEQVKAGQKLVEFDKKAIADAGYPDVVVFLLTNSDDYENVTVG